MQLVGRFAGIATGSRNSPARCRTCARWPTSSSAGCWTPSTRGRPAGWDGGDPPRRFAPTAVAAPAPLTLDLRSGAIRTILWATGFRPDLSWLDVPVFDRKGRFVHDGGVTASPGLYLMGMPFLRRRKSTLIDGAAADAADLSRHLAHYLDSQLRSI